MSIPYNITQSGLIVRGQGQLKGLVINSHTSGTVAIYDGTEAGVAASSTLTSSGAMVPASHGQNILTSSGAMVAGTHAVSVFTSSGVVIDGQTITIGTRVYTAKQVPDTTNLEVGMGANAEEFLTNLYNAINGDYGSIVADSNVVAVAHNATTITVRGRVPGTSLNAVATTETFTNGSWADTTLGGGTGASDAGVTTAAATVTIGANTYTIVDALSETYGATAVPFQVLKGANEAAMLANLRLAINATGTAGTNYSTGTTVHPYLICSANDATTITVVSRTVGNAAATAVVNALATTETMANTAWADATFGGGAGASNPAVTSDAATFSINGRTYTAVLELSETSGATAVVDQILWVTSEAVFLDNIKLAINATGIAGTNYSTGTTLNADVVATTNSNTQQVIVAKLSGTVGNAITTTETIGNYAWTSTVLAGGTGATSKLMYNTITFSVVATTGERYIDFKDADFSRGLYCTVG